MLQNSLLLAFTFSCFFTFQTTFAHVLPETTDSEQEVFTSSIGPPVIVVPTTYCYTPRDFFFSLNVSHAFANVFDSTKVLDFPPGPEPYLPHGHNRVSFTLWNNVRERYVTWKELEVVHEMKSHLLFVSEDAETFGHVHVEDFWPAPKPEDVIFNVHFDFRRAKSWYLKFESSVSVPACLEREFEIKATPLSLNTSHGHASPATSKDKQDTHTKHEHAVYPPMVKRSMSPQEGNRVLTVETMVKVHFGDAPHASRVAVTSKSLVSQEWVYSFPVADNGRHTYPIPLAQLQSRWTTPSAYRPGLMHYSSPDVYRFLSPQLSEPFPQGECTPVYFHVAMLRAPYTHPVEDMVNILSASAHITLFHEASGTFAHVHGEALRPEQISPPALRQISKLLVEEDRSSNLDSLLYSKATQEKNPMAAMDLCAESHHHANHNNDHHHQHHHGEKQMFGPLFGFPLTLPHKGWWKMMIQTKRGSNMIVPSFWIQVV